MPLRLPPIPRSTAPCFDFHMTMNDTSDPGNDLNDMVNACCLDGIRRKWATYTWLLKIADAWSPGCAIYVHCNGSYANPFCALLAALANDMPVVNVPSFMTFAARAATNMYMSRRAACACDTKNAVRIVTEAPWHLLSKHIDPTVNAAT